LRRVERNYNMLAENHLVLELA